MLSDVARVVTHSLEATQRPHLTQYRTNGPRIFHHEGHEAAHGTRVLGVDLPVRDDRLHRHIDIQAGERIKCPSQHVAHVIADVANLDEAAGVCRAVFRCFHRLARNLARLVTDALKVGCDFGYRQHQTQVAGGGLAPGENT